MNQSAKFWDKIAKRYSKQPVADEASYQEKLRVTRTYFRPDTDVLEFGCGTGSPAINHSPYVRHIHAIDISSKMIEIAQEKADEGKVSNVTFEQSTIEGVSVPDQSLDAVLGLSILHLLENKEGAIAKVHRMLKPGGLFISSTVCLTGIMTLLKLIVPIGRLFGFMPQVLKFFTAKELEKSLTDAGFEIDYQWTQGKGKAVFIVAKKAE